MRNLEKGQHIFIAFQGGKAVLDSQLRRSHDGRGRGHGDGEIGGAV